MLAVTDLAFRYGPHTVFSHLSFEAHPGEIVALMGPNGAGKTTLLRCLNHLLPPSAGTVRLEKIPIPTLSLRDRARRIAHVPQKSEPGHLTAFDTVLLGRLPHVLWGVGEQDLRKTEGALRQFGLESLALRQVRAMSGGEYQMVLLARAMAQEPHLLLLDEPTSSLDLHNQLEILKALRRVVSQHRMIAVASIHDLNLALRVVDRLLFLAQGTLVADVTPAGVTSAIIRATYGVDVDLLEHRGFRLACPCPR